MDGMAAHALMRLHTDASGDWEALLQPFPRPLPTPQVSKDSRQQGEARPHTYFCHFTGVHSQPLIHPGCSGL